MSLLKKKLAAALNEEKREKQNYFNWEMVWNVSFVKMVLFDPLFIFNVTLNKLLKLIDKNIKNVLVNSKMIG